MGYRSIQSISEVDDFQIMVFRFVAQQRAEFTYQEIRRKILRYILNQYGVDGFDHGFELDDAIHIAIDRLIGVKRLKRYGRSYIPINQKNVIDSINPLRHNAARLIEE